MGFTFPGRSNPRGRFLAQGHYLTASVCSSSHSASGQAVNKDSSFAVSVRTHHLDSALTCVSCHVLGSASDLAILVNFSGTNLQKLRIEDLGIACSPSRLRLSVLEHYPMVFKQSFAGDQSDSIYVRSSAGYYSRNTSHCRPRPEKGGPLLVL